MEEIFSISEIINKLTMIYPYIHRYDNPSCISLLSSFMQNRVVVAQSIDSAHSAPYGGTPGEKPSCTLMAPGACRICRGCNALQVPIQNYSSGDTKAGEPAPPGRIKIAMACLWITLRDESQTVSNSPLA